MGKSGEGGCRGEPGQKQKYVNFKIFLGFFLSLLTERQKKKHPCVSEFRKRRVFLVLQGSDRCTVTASPQNTAHPQVGLINLARHC